MSTQRIHVWPRPGFLVRHETTLAPIPAEGEAVPLTRLIQRRIAAGDLLTTDPNAKAEKPKAKAERTQITPESEG